MEIEKSTCTLSQAAKLLKCSKDSVVDLINNNKIQGFKSNYADKDKYIIIADSLYYYMNKNNKSRISLNYFDNL